MATEGYPAVRMRRLRRTANLRALVQSHKLHQSNLIQPLFVSAGSAAGTIASMPGIQRIGIDCIADQAQKLYGLGLKTVMLFPVVAAEFKSPSAEQAWDEGGLIPKAVRAIKERIPDMVVITDVALDPYTNHGHDGLIDDSGYVDNDRTVEALVRQALCHASSGADVVAPSDMMDGRIGAIRQALEKNGLVNTVILSYAVKYASCLYGPFRDAVGSAAQLGGSGKQSYQMDPANDNEALRECALDLSEGADILMVKPALPYLDIVYRIKQRFGVPVFAYMVSGEYGMVNAAAERGWIDQKQAVLEMLTACRRAGADAIVSYHATLVAEWMQQDLQP